MQIGLYYDLRNPTRWERPMANVYANALEQIEEAERLGIGSVWLTEHHFFVDGYLPQPFTFAAAIAARTTRLRIGTAISIAGLRPPVDIAEQGAIVDIISNGRFELGLGAGYVPHEFAAFGADPAQRFSTLEGRAREVRRLWDEGAIAPLPVQERVPMWIGTQGPRGAKIAGTLGEGMLWLDTDLVETYRDALVAAGHDETRARVSGLANMIVVDDPEAAWPRIAPHLGYQWSSYAAHSQDSTARELREHLGDTLEGEQADPELLRAPGPVMNPPAFDVVTATEAVDRFRRWLTPLPVEHVYLWASIAGMPDDLVQRHIELLATEVAPKVADLGVVASR
jgi:alkanesulfonate monooxygenase SsuD/methylene tetrahydromethanopterin reductase-like flavin-dependent oxidoreductase (luciferase family)